MAPPVKSAQRVVEVFEFFAQRRAPATLSQVCSALGYPASSTFALLNTLRDLGYLDYARDDRTFVPTVKAALLGIWVNDALLRDDSIVGVMYELRDRTGCTCVLGIQSGFFVQYIHVVKGSEYADRTDVTTGALRPLLHSAMGDVILALKSRHEIRALVHRINAEEPPERQARLTDVLARVERTRDGGHGYSEGLATPGSGTITMLLAAPQHQPPMVLGLGARISALRANRERFVAALRKVVDEHRGHMEALPLKFAARR
ncbi:MAG: helix-turn-helix domain-containing protein [Betaproteobacteria bacterium]|jgi:DNA-binding IclR family transcriptional regulator|nr:helix-turn-helix domain-containing protein [Betaproteobacteria bacterium]MCC6246183.1 helix-turn-helix domain-containing protein [Rubrivivax sp.]